MDPVPVSIDGRIPRIYNPRRKNLSRSGYHPRESPGKHNKHVILRTRQGRCLKSKVRHALLRQGVPTLELNPDENRRLGVWVRSLQDDVREHLSLPHEPISREFAVGVPRRAPKTIESLYHLLLDRRTKDGSERVYVWRLKRRSLDTVEILGNGEQGASYAPRE